MGKHSLQSTNITKPPPNSVFDYHTGSPRGLFHNLRFYLPPLTKRFGAYTTLDQFEALSRLQAFATYRSMFEEYQVSLSVDIISQID